MDFSVPYRPTSADIVSEAFDGEFVVLDLGCGKYFSFTDCGSVIWGALVAGAAPAAVLDLGVETLSHACFEEFFGKLVTNGLIVAAPGQPPRPPAADLAARLAAAKEEPELSTFDDLADLFLADPVHDVDQWVGWPEVRPAQA